MRAFGDHLRLWRRERAISQLALASLADTSARHLSFLESGRSAPGRAMVLRLSDALGVSPAERDQALESAGLAPVCPRASLDDADASAVERAIATLLDGHGRLPAFVLDADWALIDHNEGGERLLRVLDPGSPGTVSAQDLVERSAGAAHTLNLIDLLVAHADDGVIVNWSEVARLALARARAELVRRDKLAPAFDASVEKLAAACARRVGETDGFEEEDAAFGSADDGGTMDEERSMASSRAIGAATTSAVVPLRIEAEGTTLSLLSMVAQFGGVEYLDVAVPSVELMFAADEATRHWFERE